MFIQHFTGGRLQPTGTLHAHRAFGRPSECVNDAEILPLETGFSIELIKQNITNTSHYHPAETTCHISHNTSSIQFRGICCCTQSTNSPLKYKTRKYAVYEGYYYVQSKLLKRWTHLIFSVGLLPETITLQFVQIVFNHISVSLILLIVAFIQVLLRLTVVYSKFRILLLEAPAYYVFVAVNFDELISGCVSCCAAYRFLVSIAAVTVCALYAGTLVTFRTTAPFHIFLRSSSVLLAAFCLILATLTIAARCYASTNAKHPVVQFFPYPRFLSPITFEDSNSRTNTSKIVLSRLFTNFRKDVQSDTRIIVTNSKQLLYNQNFTIRTTRRLTSQFRTKREFHSVQPKSINSFSDDENDFSFDAQERSNHLKTNEVYYVAASEKTADFYNRKFDSSQKSVRTNLKNLFKTSANRQPKDVPVILEKEEKDSPVADAEISESTGNKSVNFSRVSNKLLAVDQQNDISFNPTFVKNPVLDFGTQRPMPPAHDLYYNSLSESGVLVLVVSVVVLTVALGLVTCVLSHYRGGTAANPHDAAQTPTTAPMLSVVSAGAAAGVGGMDRLHGRGTARELAATRDRQVRVHAVHTDIAINLPPSIAMPDGEEHPFTSSRLHIRDTEQESEIYQKCIKPPPNRTVLESESPPPYRSSSAGLLGSISGSSSGSSDWSGGSAPLVVRCHSMSSTSKRPEAGSSGQKTDFIQRTVKIFTGKKSQPPSAPTLPVVIVPAKPRRTPDQQNSAGRPKPSV